MPSSFLPPPVPSDSARNLQSAGAPWSGCAGLNSTKHGHTVLRRPGLGALSPSGEFPEPTDGMFRIESQRLQVGEQAKVCVAGIRCRVHPARHAAGQELRQPPPPQILLAGRIHSSDGARVARCLQQRRDMDGSVDADRGRGGLGGAALPAANGDTFGARDRHGRADRERRAVAAVAALRPGGRSLRRGNPHQAAPSCSSSSPAPVRGGSTRAGSASPRSGATGPRAHGGRDRSRPEPVPGSRLPAVRPDRAPRRQRTIRLPGLRKGGRGAGRTGPAPQRRSPAAAASARYPVEPDRPG